MNNLYVLLLFFFYNFIALAMDTHIDLKVKCVALKDQFEIGKQTLQENKCKCVALGLGWVKPGERLVKIIPIHINPKGKDINCLLENPSTLRKRIMQNSGKQRLDNTPIKQFSLPQLPEYIPYNAVYGSDVQETADWELYGCNIKAHFFFDEELKPTDWNLGKEKISFFLFLKDIAAHPLVLFYVGCVALATVYVYV